MSEHITHIAVYEDVARIAQHTDRVAEPLKTSLRNAWDVGLFASSSRGVHLVSVPMLEKYRDQWDGHQPGDGVEERIAAALGWLLHRAADMQMKALEELFLAEMAEERPNPFGFYKDEFEIYQDAVAFREVYDGGRIQPDSPYSPLSPATLAYHMAPHPATIAVDVAAIEPLIAGQINIRLLDLHQSAVAQRSDLRDWMNTFFYRRQRFAEPLPVYIEAYQNPVREKMAHYMARWNWYDAGDALIRWARALQRNTPPPDIPLEDAIVASRTQSQYAQALHLALVYLEAAGDFFNYRIDKPTFHDIVENYVEEWREITF